MNDIFLSWHIIMHIFFGKILFSHLSWIDSHLFFRSNFKLHGFTVHEIMGSALSSLHLFYLKSDRQKRCESSQKRCENRIFLFFTLHYSWQFLVTFGNSRLFYHKSLLAILFYVIIGYRWLIHVILS
jgi:hypothetical protein